MLTLIQYPAAFGLPSASPFCMKAEILLKLSGLEYEVETNADPRKMPMGKLPVVRDADRIIADSALIQAYLESAYGCDLDSGVPEQDRAIAHAFCRMLEERTYWVLVYSRWLDDGTWPKIREQFFGGLPLLVRFIVPAMARKDVRRTLHGQGLGRHRRNIADGFGADDIRAVANWLGDKNFFLGEEPTSADATVYAFLANAAGDVPFDGPLKKELLTHENLLAYVDRCRDIWFR